MLEIDFFADAVAYIDSHASNAPSKPQKTQEHEIKADNNIYPDAKVTSPLLGATKPQKAKIKAYSIDLENKTVTIKGTTYPMPDVFNKKMIAQGDKKTIEMMFIYLGHAEIEA